MPAKKKSAKKPTPKKAAKKAPRRTAPAQGRTPAAAPVALPIGQDIEDSPSALGWPVMDIPITPAHAAMVERVKRRRDPPVAPTPSETLLARAEAAGVKLEPFKAMPDGTRRSRCQFTVTRSEKAQEAGPYQCGRWAVMGSAVCPMHGRGTRARVERGERRDPRVTMLEHGEYATIPADTVKQELYSNHRMFRDLLAQELGKRDLLDLTEQVATAKALAKQYLHDYDSLKDRAYGKQLNKPVLNCLAALDRAFAGAEAMVRIEEKRGAVTRAELQRLLYGINAAVARFVRPADQAEFYELARRYSAGHAQVPAGYDPVPDRP